MRPRIYRRARDSSVLVRPRVFARAFANTAALARAVGFYEALAKTPLDQDIDIPEAGLHVVAVGPFLILALDRDKLGEERYHQATQTRRLLSHVTKSRTVPGTESDIPMACWLSTSNIAQVSTMSMSHRP